MGGCRAALEWTAQKCAARDRGKDRTRFDDDGKKRQKDCIDRVELLEGVLD